MLDTENIRGRFLPLVQHMFPSLRETSFDVAICTIFYPFAAVPFFLSSGVPLLRFRVWLCVSKFRIFLPASVSSDFWARVHGQVSKHDE